MLHDDVLSILPCAMGTQQVRTDLKVLSTDEIPIRAKQTVCLVGSHLAYLSLVFERTFRFILGDDVSKGSCVAKTVTGTAVVAQRCS